MLIKILPQHLDLNYLLQSNNKFKKLLHLHYSILEVELMQQTKMTKICQILKYDTICLSSKACICAAVLYSIKLNQPKYSPCSENRWVIKTQQVITFFGSMHIFKPLTFLFTALRCIACMWMKLLCKCNRFLKFSHSD